MGLITLQSCFLQMGFWIWEMSLMSCCLELENGLIELKILWEITVKVCSFHWFNQRLWCFFFKPVDVSEAINFCVFCQLIRYPILHLNIEPREYPTGIELKTLAFASRACWFRLWSDRRHSSWQWKIRYTGWFRDDGVY